MNRTINQPIRHNKGYDMEREEIKEIIARKNVNFFRLQFVDIFGFMKNISFPLSQIEKALDGKRRQIGRASCRERV